jgi:hypothetical protein
MLQQARNFVLNVATKVNLYQLVALGLVLGTAIIGMPTGGGGGGA